MKSRRETDLELVESAQAGDARAFEILMNRYKTRLVRHLSPVMQDAGEAEDVIQETFIKAYLALNSFRGDAAFSTWLYRIAINTAKRFLVRSNRRKSQFGAPLEDEQDKLHHESETDLDTPDAKLESKQILALLDAALDALPEDQRTSLVLRELEGLSYEEIAEQMHCPVGTVRSRIHRARDSIAAKLKPH